MSWPTELGQAWNEAPSLMQGKPGIFYVYVLASLEEVTLYLLRLKVKRHGEILHLWFSCLPTGVLFADWGNV